jgi:hypothetical protein
MRSFLAAVTLLLFASPLAAQRRWGLTLEVARAGYSAAAHDSSAPRVAVGPSGPTLLTLRLDRSGTKSGPGLGITYTNAPIGGSVDEVTVLIARSLELVEIAPEWRVLVREGSTGARLVAHLGPVADGWGPEAEPIRWRFGGMAGATLEFPLSTGWRVGIRGDFAVTGSYLRREDDDDEIDVEPTMRRTRIGLGITRRL